MPRWLLYIFLPTIVLIYGCKSDSQTHKNIFYWNIATGFTSMDPAFARIQANIWVTHQLFNGLIQLDDSLNIKPCIAKSWEISKDAKTYTFHLRNDVLFHPHKAFSTTDMRKVTAQDFVYSFKRLMSGKTASPGSWIFNDKIDTANNFSNAFRALNDSTFQITLTKPFSPLLHLLGLEYCAVVPEEVVELYGKDFRANPVGTGPFKMKKYYDGEKLLIERNEEYFELDSAGNRLPYIDGAEITFMTSKQSEFFSFAKGDLSVLTGLDKSFKDNILTRNGDVKPPYSEKYNFEVSPYLNTEYLGILVDEKLLGNSPLRLKKVRQAMNYAIDRAKMMRYLRNDIGDPGIYGFVPPSLIENDKKYYDYNPEKARNLLQEAGFKPNEPIRGLKLATTEIYLDMAIFIQKQLESVGIFIEIDNAPPGTLSEWKAQSKTQFFRGSWVADYADAENYLSVFYSKNWSPDGPNYFHYKNPEFDRLYEQVLLLTDEKQKQLSYAKMQDILMEDAPVIVLFYDEVIRLKQKNVKGLAPNAINLINLKGVRLE